MKTESQNLAGKAIIADRVARELSLTGEESDLLDDGSFLSEAFLRRREKENGGILPNGAEDDAVDYVESKLPGYTRALDKWANSFRKTLIAGKG